MGERTVVPIIPLVALLYLWSWRLEWAQVRWPSTLSDVMKMTVFSSSVVDPPEATTYVSNMMYRSSYIFVGLPGEGEEGGGNPSFMLALRVLSTAPILVLYSQSIFLAPQCFIYFPLLYLVRPTGHYLRTQQNLCYCSGHPLLAHAIAEVLSEYFDLEKKTQ